MLGLTVLSSNFSKKLCGIFNTGYAVSSIPFLIVKEDNNYDEIHYDSTVQRLLGKRYYQKYIAVIQ